VAGCGDDHTAEPSTAAHRDAPRRSGVPAPCRALRVRVTGRVGDPSASELSGLVRSRSQAGVLWSHDDSGSGPVLYALRADGRVAGKVTVTGAEAEDWEDIATGPGRAGMPLLYVGDIGDNRSERPAIDVYRVPEPRLDGRTATAPARRLRLRYPDGAHDAEALLVDPLRHDLLVVTKALTGARAYRGSTSAARQTLRAGPPIDLPLVTAGDVSADGRVVALRGYDRVAAWVRRGREPLTTTLRRRPCVSPTSLLPEGQGEALALDRRGTSFFTVAEGSPAVLRRYAPRRVSALAAEPRSLGPPGAGRRAAPRR
jgi:hypothetical protein